MAGRNSQTAAAPATTTTTHDSLNGNTSQAADLPASNAAGKKAKTKKAPDANEVGKALAAKISQLELDAAEEKDQELDIEREVKKATRDLTNLLNQIDNPMSKLDTLQKKYSELLADMRRMDRENTKNKKRADQYQKEKDQGRSQLTKTDAVKAKLESVCRELQRENKKLKDDNKRIEIEERANREELSDRADTLFWELNESMNRGENSTTTSAIDPPSMQAPSADIEELFRQRFKTFLEQYELRELHALSVLKMKDSEVQLNMARADEHRRQAESEAAKSRNLSAQVSTFSQTETELRSQLNIYVEKFKQVEDTLNNSNDLFLTFRKEMEEMSKKTKRLEKENLNLNRKHDLTNRNILEMAEERTKVNKEFETLRKKNQTLESLVRRMQDQGRVIPGATRGARSSHSTRGGGGGGNHAVEGMVDEEGTESEYADDDDEDLDDEEEYEEELDDEEEDGEDEEGTFEPSLGASGGHPPQPPSTVPAAVSTAQRANLAYGPANPKPALASPANAAKKKNSAVAAHPTATASPGVNVNVKAQQAQAQRAAGKLNGAHPVASLS